MDKLTFNIATALLMSISTLLADDHAELHNKATSGDAKAQLDLAMRYRDGKGVAKDDAQAI